MKRILPFLFFAFTFAAQSQDCDLLITNGKIIDGTGNSWYYGNIAVKNGKIIKIGRVPMCQPLYKSVLSGRCNSWPIFRAFARHFSIDAPDCINRRARLCERGQRAENSGIAYTAFLARRRWPGGNAGTLTFGRDIT